MADVVNADSVHIRLLDVHALINCALYFIDEFNVAPPQHTLVSGGPSTMGPGGPG